MRVTTMNSTMTGLTAGDAARLGGVPGTDGTDGTGGAERVDGSGSQALAGVTAPAGLCGALRHGWRWVAVLGAGVLMAGCGGGPSQRGATAPTAPTTAPAASARPASPLSPAPVPAPEAPAPLVNAQGRLEPPHAVSTHEELRHQAALRLVAANPDATYMGEVPAVLLAIPVLEVELNRDGSVRNIRVLRRPGQAVDTIELAMAAVRKAAPYGDVSHLPHPWKFNEVFLFNNDRRFKPRTLD